MRTGAAHALSRCEDPAIRTHRRVKQIPRPETLVAAGTTSEAAGAVPVIYIAGIGRSGSTLLARTLGEVDGIAAAGEGMHFFGRGLTNAELCGCGAPVPDCSMWGGVAHRIAPDSESLPAAAIERLRQRTTEGPLLPTMLSFLTSGPLENELESYRSWLGRLYWAIRAESNADLIVDSSKNAIYARLLQEPPGVRMFLVHLVRDSRGVAHSLGKEKRRPGTTRRTQDPYLDRRGPASASIFWLAAQLMVERLRERGEDYLRVRYRDFVRRPGRTVRRILHMTGLTPRDTDLRHIRDGTLDLGTHHVLAGNPIRDEVGTIDLEEDTSWERKLSPVARGLITGLTFPLLRRYGYLTNGEPDGHTSSS